MAGMDDTNSLLNKADHEIKAAAVAEEPVVFVRAEDYLAGKSHAG
jgi:hypothetical protein